MISTVTRNPSLFRILAVSGTFYISLPPSLIYLFFTYAVWLDEIAAGNMSFIRVANIYKINFRSVFSKDIGL